MVKLLVCGDVRAPVRKSGYDAGIDLFVPNLSEQFMADLAKKNPGHPYRWGVLGAPVEKDSGVNEGLFLYLAPGEDILIPTYVKARIPENMYLRITNKSGVCTKQKLIVGADTVDSSYEGVMHVHLFNPTGAMHFIEFGQAIAQAIPEIIDDSEISVEFDESSKEGVNRQAEEAKKLSKEYTAPTKFTTSEAFFDGHKTLRKDKGFGEGNPDVDGKKQ